MHCLISLSIILALGSGPAAEKVPVDDFKAFFTALYNPSVHYDSSGRVLKEGSPLTAGHIIPDWESATVSYKGKGRKQQSVCTVPITVEREIYTALEDAGPEAVRERADRELVISCSKNRKGGIWSAAIRYRITDPRTHIEGKFTGLEIDVDPNTFAVLSVLGFKKGRIVLRENYLRDGVHPEKHSATLVGADLQNRYAGEGDIHTVGDEVYRAYEVFGMTGGIYGGMIRSRSSTDSEGLGSGIKSYSETALNEALNRFKYYPVTISSH